MSDKLTTITETPILTVWKRFRFEAAHWLPNVPKTHKCHHMHGHSYEVQLGVTGSNDPKMGWVIDYYEVQLGVTGSNDPKMGWVIDYADIKTAFDEWVYIFDHNTINNITGLSNSTAENLAIFIAERMKPKLAGLSCVRVFETPDAWVELMVK